MTIKKSQRGAIAIAAAVSLAAIITVPSEAHSMGVSSTAESGSSATAAAASAVSASGVSLPGVAPGAASAFIGGNANIATVALDNSVIGMTFAMQDSRAKISRLENKQTKELAPVTTSTWFAMTLADGTVIKDGDLNIVSLPVVTNIAADTAAAKLGKRSAGKRVTSEFHYNAAKNSFKLLWIAELRDNANYVHQRFIITPAGGALSYKSLKLIDLNLAGARVEGQDDGSPIVAGGAYKNETFFYGIENPMSKPVAADGKVSVSLPSATPLAAGQSVEVATGIGVSTAGQMRRSFHYYVERERAHARHTFLHYQSWYDLKPPGLMINSTKLSTAINMFGKQLTDRGAKIDSYWVDDGWDYLRSPQVTDESKLRVWSFDPTQFPTGFGPQKAAAAKYGGSMSVWMSPFGGYDPSSSLRTSLNSSKPAAEQLERNSAGFTLSGPKYYEAFKTSVFDMMDNQGVRGFKFDGIGGGLYQSGPNAAYLKDYEALLKLIGEMRVHQPDVWVNATVGTWGSPYWLWYVDSIWRDGHDNGQVGEGSTTQKYVSHRDTETIQHETIENPLFPTSNVMNHGIVFSTYPNNPHFSMDMDLSKASVQADYTSDMKAYFSLGLGLQELYVMHEAVDPTKPGATKWWDTLAGNAKWARDREALLNDARYIGGSPSAGEVYGNASWSEASGSAQGVIMLRNPSSVAKKFTIDPKANFQLPTGASGRYEFVERDGLTASFVTESATPYTLEVKPYQVLLFSATPSSKAVSASPFVPDPKPLDSSMWLASAISQQTQGENGLASNAIDGNTSTYWHTQYSPSSTAMPHWLKIDMGTATTWAKMDYVPRPYTTSQPNGLIKDYKLEVSDDNVSWRQVAAGQWADWGTRQVRSIVPAAPVTARYVRLTSTSSSNGLPFSTAAELQFWPRA